MKKINNGIDKTNKVIEELAIHRWHVFFVFVILGLFLVVLPLFNIIHLSFDVQQQVGNYIGIIGTGVSLVTLAEAKRINQRTHEIHEVQKDIRLKTELVEKIVVKSFEF
jgi:hypothetical protein